MIIGRIGIQFKRENSNFNIKRSNIFHVNQKSESEPYLATSLEIRIQSKNLASKTVKTSPILTVSLKIR